MEGEVQSNLERGLRHHDVRMGTWKQEGVGRWRTTQEGGRWFPECFPQTESLDWQWRVQWTSTIDRPGWWDHFHETVLDGGLWINPLYCRGQSKSGRDSKDFVDRDDWKELKNKRKKELNDLYWERTRRKVKGLKRKDHCKGVRRQEFLQRRVFQDQNPDPKIEHFRYVKSTY